MLKKLAVILAVIILLAGCTTPTEPTEPTEPLEITGENAENADIATSESEFVEERVGDLWFIRPAHWDSVSSQEPHGGTSFELWDGDFAEDQPFFRVLQLPIEGDVPTLDDLLAEMLDELDFDEVIVADIEPIIHPIDAAVVFGSSGGMEMHEIRLVHRGWLYFVTGLYSQDNEEHRGYVLRMIETMFADDPDDPVVADDTDIADFPDIATSEIEEYPEDPFTWERVGDVSFIRPSHWAAVSQLEPYECIRVSFWDAEYPDNTPYFQVRQLPIESVAPTLDDLLAEMLAEVEIAAAEGITVSRIAPLVYPVDVAVVSGLNWSRAEVHEIRLVYNDWLYIISASYSLDNDEHRSYVLAMLESLVLD
ncbi:MAG: hypothetical protein FWG63_07865 [Defluviitaleaceae bacterium]|nr:hypothetical protein [Defluviitaleaceae bacterium]